MIVYNVTTKTNHNISSEWLHWLQHEHITDIIATGCFTRAVILRLLETDESEGKTYAVQYYADSLEAYQRYIELFAGEMRTKAIGKWGDQVISFRSVLEVVS